MASRKLRLPGVHELTKEQELSRSLDLEGLHLIIGGPGTGKSVVALLRVKQLVEQKKPYVFLVFNLLLKHSCSLLANEALEAVQWQSWFISLYKKLYSVGVPRLALEPKQNYAPFDWGKIHIHIQENPLKSDALPYLVIDEGQDMPIEFYQALMMLGFENVFVVADQNQQIIDGNNSSRQDLQDALLIEPEAVIELTTNHRNYYGVARLAREFYTGDPASPPPELPPPAKHNAFKPILFHYGQSQFELMCKRVLNIADAKPSYLIALITPNHRVREKYVEKLSELASKLSDNPPLISTYQHGSGENIPFDQGGIMVINAQACKGLEFDMVFLADIDQYIISGGEPDNLKRLFYVMSSRAIERIILLSTQEKNYQAQPFLPTDQNILEWK